MRANPERLSATAQPLPDETVELLAAAVDQAVAGVAVVDARASELKVAYANEVFCALAQCGASRPMDFVVDDAVGFGAALAEAIRACRGPDPESRRLGYRLGGRLLSADVTITRHSLGGDGPFFLIVLREAAEAPEPVIADTADSDRVEARLLRAARGSGAGHWDWDLLTGRVWYERRFKELLGYGAAGFADTFAALQSLVHDDERPLMLQALRLHVESRQPFDLQVRMRTASGAYRWFRLCGAASRDPAGRPVQVSGRLEDVTEQQRAEALRRRAEESLRRTLDGLSFAVGVLNSQGELIEINRAWREFAGDRALIGLRYGFGENYARLCREAVDRCGKGPAAAIAVEDVIAGRQALVSLDYRVANEDGERALKMVIRPLDVDGRRGAIVTHKDVSDLDRANDAVRATKEFYELILDSLPLNIAYVNRRREFVYANRGYEEWFRLPLAALHGRRLEEMTTSANYRLMAPRIEAALSGRTVEYAARGMRGEDERDLAVTYLPHRVGDVVEGFFAVVRDVTQQRRLESELRHSQKLEAVGQLTGGIAHDFNNLLAVVIGNLQLLERPLKSEPRLGVHITTALRAALRGADLTRRLLAFARQQVLEPRLLSPSRLVGGTKDLLKRTLGAAIELRSELAADTWLIFADPAQFESSVLNLAINARDAMPDGGCLTLATRNASLGDDDPFRHPSLAPGDYVEVCVRDTGIGMTPEVQKRAFEPFFTTKETGKGTGLGLSMVYGFLEQSGGVATIDSEPGRGTAVHLWFPRSLLPGSVVLDGEGDELELPSGRETVLVVDGDVDVRATAASALRMLGYRVLEAGSGAQALEALDREPAIGLLLADLILPGGMLGAELASRAQSVRAGLRVLHTSALSQPGLRDLSAPTGSNVLHKPYAIGELARRVRAVLDTEYPHAD
jgi:PAS domain S-box-containing protein